MQISQVTGTDLLDIALDTLAKDKQALVFVNTKASAEKAAEDIAKAVAKRLITLSSDTDTAGLAEQALKAAAQPTKQCRRLSMVIQQGIAFHHAGLLPAQRELIEDNFREGSVKIICCTPTLAAGVDLPAFRTIIRDVKRFGASGGWGMSFIPVLEYHQMAGRAGRPGKETFGEAITIAQTEDQQDLLVEKYVRGLPEEIYSKLAVEPVLRTYVLSLIATGYITSRSALLAFFSRTFWAFQFEDLGKIASIMDKMIDLLAEFEFIQTTKRDGAAFVSAADLTADRKLAPTRLGERVAQLYIDPLTAHDIITALQSSEQQDVFPLLHLIAQTLEMRPYIRVKTAEYENYNSFLASHSDELLIKEPPQYDPEYDEFLDTIKTACFFSEWVDEKEEEYLLEKFNVRPGETRYKIDRADWLLYAAQELARITNLNDCVKALGKLRIRVKYGVKEELLTLLRLKGIGRVRARKLHNNGIKTVADIKKADIVGLGQLLGKAVASQIKSQVEDLPTQVPDGKRKGQLGLGKY